MGQFMGHLKTSSVLWFYLNPIPAMATTTSLIYSQSPKLVKSTLSHPYHHLSLLSFPFPSTPITFSKMTCRCLCGFVVLVVFVCLFSFLLENIDVKHKIHSNTSISLISNIQLCLSFLELVFFFTLILAFFLV